MPIQVTYIISNINKALAFEWIANELDKRKINLSFVLLNPSTSELETFLIESGFSVKRITYHGKKSILLALIKIIFFLKKQKTKTVHTHLFDANIVGLIAAKLCGIKKRIYTRHHSSYHHNYFPKAVKYDKLCNWLATDIIAITQTVRQILQQDEGVPEFKIRLIHHGFKLEDFKNIPTQEIEELKQKYSSVNSYPVIGVISRYTEWKGIQYIIPAFKKILINYPHAKLILANAKGDYENDIKKMLSNIPNENYTEIEFENNLFALYKLFDVFVHVPIDNHSEAFGQIYIESIAASVPSVVTISGIANDFIKNNYNALVVDYENSNSIYNAINEIICNKSFADELIKNGQKDIKKLFPLSKMISELELLYLKS